MKLEFFPLAENHLSDVLSIEKTSFPNPWTKQMFEREIALAIARFYIVKADFSFAGYGGFWIVEDEAHLINIAVHPDFRNKGIAKEFMGFLLKKAVEARLVKMLLEVRESNEAAQKLYKGLGFNVVGLRPKYYGNEAAVLMDKQL